MVDYGTVVQLAAPHTFAGVQAQVAAVQQADFDYIRGYHGAVDGYTGGRNLAFCSHTNRVYINNIYPVGAGANTWTYGYFTAGHVWQEDQRQLTEVCDLVAGNLGFNYRNISDDLNRICALYPAALDIVNEYAEELRQTGSNPNAVGVQLDLDTVFEFDTNDIYIAAEHVRQEAGMQQAVRTLDNVRTIANTISQRIMNSIMWYVNRLVPRPLVVPQVSLENIFWQSRNFWNFAHTEYEIMFHATVAMENPLPAMHIISRLDMCDPVEDAIQQYHWDFLGCERFFARMLDSRRCNLAGSVIDFISFTRYHNSGTKNRRAIRQTPSLRLIMY